MAIYIVIDKVSGERVKIDTHVHDVDSLTIALTDEFFHHLEVEEAELRAAGVQVDGMRNAIYDLASDLMRRMIRRDVCEYLQLEVI